MIKINSEKLKTLKLKYSPFPGNINAESENLEILWMSLTLNNKEENAHVSRIRYKYQVIHKLKCAGLDLGYSTIRCHSIIRQYKKQH